MPTKLEIFSQIASGKILSQQLQELNIIYISSEIFNSQMVDTDYLF